VVASPHRSYALRELVDVLPFSAGGAAAVRAGSVIHVVIDGSRQRVIC